ncbi:hypothetical protein OLZ32_10895 [Rhizobium sp. 1AS11]|uniref:hypothetical protein n=1 Tax=Rhizobium acaciae TaxID=2989736 RepID=UPI00222326B5|nr:hypothetical protein [Rhizobium acaciae]MCW1408483.1 hypothetical protein [Rhizobium acaciae]MCW1740917.1 hypothetical protein [Rhizobium acaciae]
MPKLHHLRLPGGMTERGFWLYVWRVQNSAGIELLYVGRTGDNSSPFAASTYRRMGQHLGDAKNTNALLTHLSANDGERPIHHYEEFEMFSYGPIFPEVDRHPDFVYRQPPHWEDALELHQPFRDRMAALEKKLAGELKRCGYRVMNSVNSKAVLDPADWPPVRDSFAEHFERLKGRP